MDQGRRIARAYAACVVWLRHLIVLGWAAAVIAALVFLPSLGDVGSDAGGLVKDHSSAIAAQQRSADVFGYPLLTEVALVQRDPQGLSKAAQRRVFERATQIDAAGAKAPNGLRAAVPVINAGGAMSTRHERSTTALTFLYFDPALTFERRVAVAHDVMRSGPTAAVDGMVGVTGVVPARVEQARAILDALPAITAGTLLLILLVVGIWQRSLLAPIVTLLAAGTAYVVAIGVVGWYGRTTGEVLAQEVEPLILVLVLGIVTDYCVFLLASTRRGIGHGLAVRPAVRRATSVTAPTILTAGLIVAGGTASLTLGTLGFFRALGPALALSAAVGTLVALTLVPALLAIVGGRVYRRVEPAPEAAQVAAVDDETARLQPFRARLTRSRLVALPLALLCIGGLALAANDIRQARLGFSLTEGVSKGSEVRRAAEAARLGFSAGIISPTEILIDGPQVAADAKGLQRVEDALRRTPGVTGVVGPAEQATLAGASRDARVLTGPTPTPFAAPSGSTVRMLVVLGDDPFSSGAIATLERLRDALPRVTRNAGLTVTGVELAGQTALAAETVQQSKGDIVRLALAALAVNLLFLMLFLRAIVAPVVLLVASVLALGAALGLTVLVSRVLGWGDVAYYTPLAAAVLLLSLGSDYNVFVVGRIWHAARTRPLADAVAVAVPDAAKPVTLAGLVLAGSFALLALAPVVALRQLAVALSTGVLIDAFVVRSLLVPSLITSLGPVAGWPGNALRHRADAPPDTTSAGARPLARADD